MKFVKTITLLMTFCVMAFGNWDRVNALGGNAGFWADDDANVNTFPAMVNNLDMIQVTGAGNESGSASVIWGEGTTWGFSFDGAGDTDGNDWVNLMWGNGTYGAVFSFGNSSNDDGWAPCTLCDGTDGDSADGASTSNELGLNFGMNMSGMDIGVGFSTGGSDNGNSVDTDDPSTFGLGVNVRRAQDVWLFNNMLVNFGMGNTATGDVTDSHMNLDCDLYTTLPTGDGVTAVFSLGFGYMSGGETGGDVETTHSMITLPSATLGVEADVTDWATVRFGMNHGYVLSSSDKVGDTEATSSGASNFDWDFGLGFDYGSFTLDMVLTDASLFNDPVRYITGRNEAALSSSATLTWKF